MPATTTSKATPATDLLKGEGGRDVLGGWDGKDTLDGGSDNDFVYGGAGNDDVGGGKGNDFLIGDAGKDALKGGDGRDWATASLDDGSTAMTIDLAKKTIKSAYGTDTRSSIENAYAGEGNDVITGSSGANSLVGYLGKDTISGSGGNDSLWGGLGKDKLTGGTGKDSFVFGEHGTAYADHITDFRHGEDKIVLFQDTFSALPLGALGAANFVLVTRAKDSNDFIIYDQKTGKLYFDVDGKGGVGTGLIATLDSKPTLTVSDLKVVAYEGFNDFWIV